jgi:predicted glycosyltransferase
MPSQHKAKIWIDLDNTPHVLFFEPIIEELTVRGFPLIVTARDAFQVCELADKKGLSYTRIGRHYGKNRVLKVAGLIFRALQLSAIGHREKPVLAVSHGARSQILLSNALRIPTILIEDYEHSQFPRTMRPTWIANVPQQHRLVRAAGGQRLRGLVGGDVDQLDVGDLEVQRLGFGN